MNFSKLPVLISVVIPTYNHYRFLTQSIESVLGQIYPHIELIIVNDGSTDQTKKIEEIYSKNKRVRWINQLINQGPSVARNLGIAHAKGQYIAFLDSDDWMYPERLSEQLEVFESNPEVDLVYTALQLITEDGQEIGELRGEHVPSQNLLATLFFRNLMTFTNTVMAKSVCFKTHLFNPRFKQAEDYELLLRLAHHYRIEYLDKTLTCYRRHSSNLSNNLKMNREAELQILRNYSCEHLKSVIEKTSFSIHEKILLEAKILFNREEFDAALELFLKITSTSGLALFYAGNCYFRMNLLERAKDAYEQSIVKDPINAACHNNLGVLFAQEKQLDRARLSFEQAIQLKSGYLDAQFNLNHLNEMNVEWKITWRELRKYLLPY